MEQVTMLAKEEAVRVNPDRIEELNRQLGVSGAEDVVCRALEELAKRLSLVGQCYNESRYREMRKNARSMAAISEQLGMSLLSQVALDVTLCVDSGDKIALAAVSARLHRVGERSLTKICDLQDPSI